MNRRAALRTGAAALAATTAACDKQSAGGTPALASGPGPGPDPSPSRRKPGPTTPPDWQALAKGLDGGLVRPGDAPYDSVRRLYNTRFDTVRPAALAQVAHPADIRECLAFARRTGTPVSVRSGGHSYAG